MCLAVQTFSCKLERVVKFASLPPPRSKVWVYFSKAVQFDIGPTGYSYWRLTHETANGGTVPTFTMRKMAGISQVVRMCVVTFGSWLSPVCVRKARLRQAGFNRTKQMRPIFCQRHHWIPRMISRSNQVKKPQRHQIHGEACGWKELREQTHEPISWTKYHKIILKKKIGRKKNNTDSLKIKNKNKPNPRLSIVISLFGPVLSEPVRTDTVLFSRKFWLEPGGKNDLFERFIVSKLWNIHGKWWKKKGYTTSQKDMFFKMLTCYNMTCINICLKLRNQSFNAKFFSKQVRTASREWATSEGGVFFHARNGHSTYMILIWILDDIYSTLYYIKIWCMIWYCIYIMNYNYIEYHIIDSCLRISQYYWLNINKPRILRFNLDRFQAQKRDPIDRYLQTDFGHVCCVLFDHKLNDQNLLQRSRFNLNH